ncbi:hypothetical protein Glove_632g6 [Diversispora epigaea]|uniref:Uncharacterized protein n=1 Tax=Diversispora epigaea TaxID=1348612 RepID=A0A397G9U0_9GLOM|nr:hypothetical protein Glove_632g6 [Diversispora epigaea]
MDTPYLKSYYRRGSTFLSSEQIEIIRTLKGKVPKYRIIRDFHINENRVDDIWESHERQQQIIQNTISSKILTMPAILSENSNRIESEILLQNQPLNDSLNHDSSILHPTDKNLDMEIFTLRETEKLGGISIAKKETIPPEISQETENPLELFKRTQKDAKKSRVLARADISKLSNSKV